MTQSTANHDSDFEREYRASLEKCALFQPADPGKVEVNGPDARIFMHNLCTQDVKNLPVGSGCEAFLTNSKARVIAHLWIGHYQTDTGSLLWLDMASGQAEKVCQHLNHYLISEQAEVVNRTAESVQFRLAGPASIATVEAVTRMSLDALNPGQNVHVAGLGHVRRQNVLAIDGIDVFCAPADAQVLRDQLIAAGAVPAGAATYNTLRVEAGLPEFGIDIDENRLAMEVGRTPQAICYTKGCFLGQETIVMARDRGQVNRLLMGVRLPDGPVPAPGNKLFRAGEEVGHVTSAVYSPRMKQVIALAYLRRGNTTPGTELLTEPSTEGRLAVACELPFGTPP